MRQELARLIDHRNLASRAQARIDAQHRDRSRRRRQQQVMQIVAEHRDRVRIGALLQLQPQLALDRRIQQPLPAIVDRQSPAAPSNRPPHAESSPRSSPVARSGSSSIRKYSTDSASPRRIASMRCDGIVFTGSRYS